MKATITLLFLTFSIVNGNPDNISKNSQPLMRIRQQSVEKERTDVEQDLSEDRKRIILSPHEYLEDNQANHLNQQVLKGFDAFMTEINEMLDKNNSEKLLYPTRLLGLIETFYTNSVKFIRYLKDHPLKWLEKRNVEGPLSDHEKSLREAIENLKFIRECMNNYWKLFNRFGQYRNVSGLERNADAPKDALSSLRSSILNNDKLGIKEYEEKMNSVLNGIAKLTEVSTSEEETDEAVEHTTEQRVNQII